MTTNPEEIDTIIVSETETLLRLDQILTSRFSKSRTYFQFLIEEGYVLLNGEKVKKRTKPKVNDEIEVHFIITPEIDITPENIPLDILFEDEHLLVINKPAGMVVHPALGNWSSTFVNALLYHCKNLPNSETLRPGIVHRLDKDTSGVLVAAKTVEAQNGLIKQFASRDVYKEYLAICIGNPGIGKVSTLIGRHPVHRKKMAVLEEGGRLAITTFMPISTNGNLSVVKALLETGRTHQIRVHLKYRNAPVLGDAIYGNPSFNEKLGVERQLLHAHILRFVHPITEQVVEFKAPIPSDMKKFCSMIS